MRLFILNIQVIDVSSFSAVFVSYKIYIIGFIIMLE